MEGRRDDLVLGRRRQEVAGHLIDDELVEGLVLVQSLDHPVTVGPDDAARVGRIAGAVGIAREIEPLPGPVFAEGGLGQEIGDDVLMLGRGEFRGFFGRRRQAGDVERQATDEDGLGGFGGPGQAFLLLTVREERVDGVGFAVLRHGRTDHGFVGPMATPGRALLDPFFEERHLGRRDRLVLLRRRHDFLRILGFKPLDEFALFGFAGQDDEVPLAVAFGVLFVVEAQLSLASFLVGSVARDAVLGQDRADLAAVADRLGGAQGADEDAEEKGGLGGHGDATGDGAGVFRRKTDK